MPIAGPVHPLRADLERLRFSPRDALLLAELVRLRHVLADDLARAIGAPTSGVRARLAGLRALGLVIADRPTVGQAAWRASAAGLRAASLPAPAAKPLRASGWLHAVTCACLSAALSAEGVTHETERELRHRRHAAAQRRPGERGTRIPDLEVGVLEGVAVEVELSPKSRRRARDILISHAGRGLPVLYLATEPAARVVSDAYEGLGPLRRGQLRLRMRPAPLLAATATRPLRPDPDLAAAIARELSVLSGGR